MNYFRLYISALFFLLTTNVAAQNMCDVEITLTPNPDNNCQYDLKVTANESCGGYNWTQFTVNAASDFMDPAEIKSVEDLYGGLNIDQPTNALAIITNSGITGNFILDAGVTYSIARFEFENGSNASEISFGISGTNPDGQATDFTMTGDADANCIAQNLCICSIDMQPNSPTNPNGGCCYDIVARLLGTQCSFAGMGNIMINTVNSGSPTSTMYMEAGMSGTTASLSGGNSMLSIAPPAAGWGFVSGNALVTVGSICFENGGNFENVNMSWSGTSNAGVPTNCSQNVMVDASCPSGPDCSCTLDYVQVDDCCYEIGATFVGADCPSLSFTDVDVNSFSQPVRGCEIYQATSSNPNITVGPTIGNTQVTFSSGTNLGNITNTRQVIGEICLNNPVDPLISNVGITLMENSGSMIQCDETIEAQTCDEPIIADKLLGDSLSNIPIKVIPVGYDKMQVLANTDRNGVNHGVLLQFDISTGTIDWIHESDPDIYYVDVAYHPGVRRSYIIGHTEFPPSTDNESVITTINKLNGNCVDVAIYQQTGREFFKKIIYSPTPNHTDHDLYIVGSKNSSLPASANDLLFLMNIKTNLQQNWYTEITHTGDDEMFRGIIPWYNKGGVFIVGNDSNNNRGAWVSIDDTGTVMDDRTFNNVIDLYDGHEFPTQQLLLVGSDFGIRQGIITLWDNGGSQIDGLVFPSLREFKEVVFDGTSFFTVAQRKTTPQENVIVQFHINSANQIVIDNAVETENGETDFKLASINLSDQNLLLYTDGRMPQTGVGFGDYDLYVGVYDFPLTDSECIDDIEVLPVPYAVTTIGPQMSGSPNMLPTPSGGPNCRSLTYECIPYCEEFVCDPGWEYTQKSCYQIQFTDTSNVNLPATYMWDINNDGTIDTMAQSFCYDFDCAGTFDVCLKVTDTYGNQKTVCKTITVLPDATPPICTGINAPLDTTVMACERGAVRTWIPPAFTDDCSDVTVTSTHNPGDFFECGTTRVTYTGTNKDGLMTTCEFDVRVDCSCAQTDSTWISCSINPDEFDFYFKLNDLTGATSCSAANVSLPGLGTVSVSLNQWDPATKTLEVAGKIQAVACPFPTGFNLRVDYSCQCSDGLPYDCVHFVPFTTPCCDSAYITTQGICKVKDEEFIDIDFFGTVKDIARVEYFVQPAPCPAGPWGGRPYQSSIGYEPLKLLPPYHNMDVCVYACVYLGPDELPCTKLITEVSTLNLCSPYDCSLNDQEYCYTGTPITPAPITYNGPLPDCDFKIDWYDNLGNYIPLPLITTTYQPPALVYRGGPNDCSEDYVYEMQLIGECDTVSCYSTITLWNEDAPEGTIELDTIKNLPLCYGDDVALVYRDSCVDPSGQWSWLESSDGITYTNIAGSGTANPIINTNRLYQDQWYGVTKQNGTCPEDTTFFHVPIKPDFTITTCTADYLDPCRESGIKLSVAYNPCVLSLNGVCNCNYTVNWFKNGQLIGSVNSTSSSASFTYIDVTLNGNYAGIYYAEVTDNCCGNTKRSAVKFIDPPVKLCISGPCYICEAGTQFTLTGLLKNGPALGNNCTYQWFILAPTGYQAIAGATGITHTTTKPGTYLLRMNCINGNTSCTQEVEFEVKDCTQGATSIFQKDEANFNFLISPNPSSGEFEIKRDGTTYEKMEVQVYNVMGQLQSVHQMSSGAKVIQLNKLNAGVYLIRMVSEENGAKTKQLVIQ